MSMFMVCAILFLMVMFLWLLGLLGAIPNVDKYPPWLCWFACLCLGVALFVFRY